MSKQPDNSREPQSESSMQAFFEQPAGLHLICKMDGTIERVNSSWERALGYTRQELEGIHIEKLIHPDDLEATRIEMEKLTRGLPVSRFKNRYRHKDGSWRTLMWWASTPESDAKIYAIAHDLTDALESQKRLELALQGADLGTWDWHIPSGRINVNERWANMLGYRLSEIEPDVKIWEALVHPDDMPAVKEALQAHLDGKKDTYETEHRVHHRDGRWIWILDKGRVIEFDEKGAPLRACGTHLDITGRKNAEIEAQQARERLEYINLILNTIRNVNQLITKQKDSRDFLQPVCEAIVSNGLYDVWIALIDLKSGAVTETHAAGDGIDLSFITGFLKSKGLPFCARQTLTRDTPLIITDPTPQCPDCPMACQHKGRARLVQRLKCDEHIYGVLSLSAPARFARDPEELGLIRELAGNLAFALDKASTRRKLELTESALENSSDTVFWIAPNGHFTFVNKAACEQLGYTRDELLSMSVADIDPDFPPERWPQHWKQMKTAGSMRFESHHRTKDGHIFPVEIYGSFIEQDDQQYIFAFVHDISARYEQQLKIEDANERLLETNRELDESRRAALNIMEDAVQAKNRLELTQFALDHAADAAFLINEDSSFGYVNDSACRSLGYSHAELLSLTVKDIDLSVDEGRWKELWNEVQKNGAIRTETSHRAKDGRVFPVEIHSNTVSFQGKTCHFVFAHDITQRIRSQEKLRRSEAQYRNLFENMTTGFALHEMIYDEAGYPADYRFLQVNPAFEQLTGLVAKEIIGRTVKEIIPDTEAYWIETYGKVTDTGEPAAFENYSKALGKYFSIRSFRPAPGQFAVIFSDVTERKRLKEALEKRVLALTRPLDDPSAISFEELFNLDEIQRIQDEFAAATGVASIITKIDGTPITRPSNFTCLSNDIIRETEKGGKNRFKSGATLGRHSPDDPIIQPCLGGGPWDAGVSITVGNQHIANWLIGQVRDDTQTDEQICTYAREIGADESAFMDAFHRVPVMSREQFDKIARSLFTLANQLSTSAYLNMQQARFIADEKRRTEELNRLSTAIEQSPETVVITDTKGVIQYVNPAFTKTTGYTREEAIGQHPSILKSGQHDPAFYAGMWKTLLAGNIWTGRIINKRKDGSLLTEETSFAPVKDRNGMITNFVAVKRDITEELMREEQFRQSQKMEAVGQLAGGVAHDFNNILQAILGFSEILASQLPEGSRELRNVLEIDKAAQRAAELTRQLLAFSRKQSIDRKLINLNHPVQDAEVLLHMLLGDAILCVFNLVDDVLPVSADSGQITQIVMNLAINARDAMPDGGQLTITTQNVTIDPQAAEKIPDAKSGLFVCLSITDTGIGMSEEVKNKLFEPFFTTKSVGKGTGLGLAVVYGIIKQNKGWIQVDSEPGRGTTFNVYFPAHTPDKSSPSRSETGAERILLVDDDPDTLKMILRILSSAGYRTATARNAEEALDIFRKDPSAINLLFSDIVLPQQSGIELAHTLRAEQPGLPILLFSGYRDPHTRWKEIDSKGYGFLQKPFSITGLLAAVHELLPESALKEPHGEHSDY